MLNFRSIACLLLIFSVLSTQPALSFFYPELNAKIDQAGRLPKERVEIASNRNLIVKLSAAEGFNNSKQRWWHLWLYAPFAIKHYGVIHFLLQDKHVSLVGMWVNEEKRGQGRSYQMISLLYDFSQEIEHAFTTVPLKKPVLIKALSNLLFEPEDENHPFFICNQGEIRSIYADFNFPKSYGNSQGIRFIDVLPENFEKICEKYFAFTSYSLKVENEAGFLEGLRDKLRNAE